MSLSVSNGRREVTSSGLLSHQAKRKSSAMSPSSKRLRISRAGLPPYDAVGLEALRDDGLGRDDASVTEPHARHDDGVQTKPDIVSDHSVALVRQLIDVGRAQLPPQSAHDAERIGRD